MQTFVIELKVLKNYLTGNEFRVSDMKLTNSLEYVDSLFFNGVLYSVGNDAQQSGTWNSVALKQSIHFRIIFQRNFIQSFQWWDEAIKIGKCCIDWLLFATSNYLLSTIVGPTSELVFSVCSIRIARFAISEAVIFGFFPSIQALITVISSLCSVFYMK